MFSLDLILLCVKAFLQMNNNNCKEFGRLIDVSVTNGQQRPALPAGRYRLKARTRSAALRRPATDALKWTIM